VVGFDIGSHEAIITF